VYQCCQFLWIVFCWLSLRFFLTFIYIRKRVIGSIWCQPSCNLYYLYCYYLHICKIEHQYYFIWFEFCLRHDYTAHIGPCYDNKTIRFPFCLRTLHCVFVNKNNCLFQYRIAHLPILYHIIIHCTCELKSRLWRVYPIPQYVIKFVSDLRQPCDFLQILQFPPPIKLIITM
jgi:hypothetical protein